MNKEKEKEGGSSLDNTSPSKNINVSKVETYSFKDLPKIFQHLAENKAINILPLKPGSKKPKVAMWKPYQDRQYPLKHLKKHKGNFGVITGSNGVFRNLVVLDIDDKKGESGLYQYFQELDTLQVKTASKGYHLYFWSKKPVNDHNYIGKLFNLDVELRGKRKIYCVLPPSSVYYSENNNVGKHELIKIGDKYPIMELNDPEEFIKDILLKAGYQIQQHITKENTTTPSPIIRDGTWKHTLTTGRVKQMVELVKPIYNEGQRQDLTLYLSGWMYKAEIDPISALEVVKTLSKNDEEQSQRITALKNSYRGCEDKPIKGSSGIYGLLTNYYATKHQNMDDKEDRDKKIKKSTSKHFGKIAKIIIHPLSILGIRNTLTLKEIYSNDALRELIRFIKQRYKPIVDSLNQDIYIYDYEEGYYKQYSEIEFKSWIDDLFPEHEFFLKDINKVRTAISNIEEENTDYIWFENGLLNTTTLELEDHTPEIFTKKRIHYSYNTKATPGIMEIKLKEILIDSEGEGKWDERKYKFFLQFFGYCFLQGNPFHMMLFITGGGGNGKSVLSNLFKIVFNELYGAVPLHEFYTPFGKMGLLGKTVNVVYDLPKKMLKQTGDIKAITGEDYLTINIKNKPPWHGKLPVKIIGMGNHLPEVTDASDGFWQRIAHFETKKKFRNTDKEDKDLKEKLKNDIEGIEWLISNSIKAYKEGPHLKGRTGWALPIGNDTTKKDYLRLSNPCYYGALELFEKTNDRHEFVERGEVIKSITELLRIEELEIPANNTPFYQAIRNIGGEDEESSKIVDGKKKTTRIFRMIKFKDSEKSSKFQVREFDENLKLELNHTKLKSVGIKSLNPPQKLIIQELSGFGVNKYGEMVEQLEIESKYTITEIKIELGELINKGVVMGGTRQ